MRWFLLMGFPLVLAACSGGPQAYGITGPGGQAGPVAPAMPGASPDAQPVPGVATTGTFYGPNYGPVTPGNGFYGYN